VDLRKEPAVLVREGPVPFSEVQAQLKELQGKA